MASVRSAPKEKKLRMFPKTKRPTPSCQGLYDLHITTWLGRLYRVQSSLTELTPKLLRDWLSNAADRSASWSHTRS